MVKCNNCGWEGSDFVDHIEGLKLSCPQCGFIRRDRNFIQYLQDAFPAKKYRRLRCLEISSSSTSFILRTKFPKIITIDIAPTSNETYGDLMVLHYKDNYFDFMVCLDVLEHIEDETSAFKEMFRVLKPFGKIIIHTPLWSEKGKVANPEDINSPKYHMSSSGLQDMRVYRYYTCEALADRLKQVGFKIKELRFVNFGLILHQDIFYELKK